MKLVVNDREVAIDADPAMPLLWALRDTSGMTGTKFGCGVAQCGACTVHLDGEADPLLHHADLRRRGQEDHHDRSRDRWHRPRRRRRACGLGQARRGAVRLLPERPDHERDRLPQVAARRPAAQRRRDRRGHGRQHLPLRHLRPHPRRGRRRRPHACLKEPPCCPTSTDRELPRALQRLMARAVKPTKPPRCRAAASSSWPAPAASRSASSRTSRMAAGGRPKPPARLKPTEQPSAFVQIAANGDGHGHHQPAGVRPGRADRACR